MVDEEIKASKIIVLLKKGSRQCFMVQRLNEYFKPVQRTWQRYRETGSVTKMPGSRKKPCIKPQNGRFLVSSIHNLQIFVCGL